MKTLLSWATLFSLASFFITSAQALEQDTTFHFFLGPVIGYQSIQRTYPVAHTQGMFIYGIRVVAGSELIAGEAMYIHGSASETFNTPTFSEVDTSRDEIRVGPRTIFPILETVQLIGRAGMQAAHDNFTTNTSTSSFSTSPNWQFDPYVGAGVNWFIAPQFSIGIDVTYIFDNELETALGFRLYI
jgi:hypothetical protein